MSLPGRIRAIWPFGPRRPHDYVTSAPSVQNALDIFRGEWVGALPPSLQTTCAGTLPLFDDPRIHWAAEHLSLAGRSVLELGPLEASHSFMLEKLGAARVMAIEANPQAYLKCLVVKEALGLSRVRFACGDFIQYLRNNPPRVDVCLASGVLYHQHNPAELIELIASVADAAYVWTVCFEPGMMQRYPYAGRFAPARPMEHKGFRYTAHAKQYGGGVRSKMFCGGSSDSGVWMERDEIVGALRYFGFSEVVVAPEQSNPQGPSLGVVARRRHHRHLDGSL